MMNPFYGENGRRAILPEIQQMILQKTGCLALSGFTRMLDPGEALHGGERIAGFGENHIHEEWKLGLSAANGMTWESEPVQPTNAEQIAFVLSLGFGNGSPLPQPNGSWDVLVNDRLAVRVRMVNHSQLWQEGPCRMAFSANRIETAEPYHQIMNSLTGRRKLRIIPYGSCKKTKNPPDPRRTGLGSQSFERINRTYPVLDEGIG